MVMYRKCQCHSTVIVVIYVVDYYFLLVKCPLVFLAIICYLNVMSFHLFTCQLFSWYGLDT